MGPADDLTIERLSAHASFARAVARGLVRDDHAADDAVQDAFVAALDHPPERNERSWFVTVARRMSLNRIRGERRRAAREASRPEREAPLTPARLAERRETLRLVTEAVLELDERYQTIVLLHFYEGLTPAEIAGQLGVPAPTVRTRLRRALAQLRGRLDDEHDGNRAAWAVPLASLAGLDRPPLLPVAAAAAAATTVGGVVMAKKLVVAAVAVVLAVAVGWSVVGSGGEDGAGSQEDVTTVDDAAADTTRRRVRENVAGESADPDAQPDEVAASDQDAEPVFETGPARIFGRVIDEVTGVGAADAEIIVLTSGGAGAEFAKAVPRTHTDADGRFDCADLPVGEHHVVARGKGRLDAHLHNVEASVGNTSETRLVLHRPRTHRGRVRVPAGVATGEVYVYAEIPSDRYGSALWWTSPPAGESHRGVVAEDGSFIIEGLAPRDYDVNCGFDGPDGRRWRASADAVHPDSGPVELVPEPPVEVPELTYRIRFVGPDGGPVTSVSARRTILTWDGSSQWGDKQLAEGVYETELPPRVMAVWCEAMSFEDASGQVVTAAPVPIELSESAGRERTVQLAPAVSLSGRLTDDTGAGVAGVQIEAWPASDLPRWQYPHRFAHGSATTGEDGAFEIVTLADIEYALRLDVPPEFVSLSDVRARPGQTSALVLRSAIRPVVTVVDSNGDPVAGVYVGVSEIGPDGDEVFDTETGADGTARLGHVHASERYVLDVEPEDDTFAPQLVRDWSPADTRIVLAAGLEIRGVVVDDAGAPLPGSRVYLRAKKRLTDRDTYMDTEDDGTFWFTGLPPGAYELVVTLTARDTDESSPRFDVTAGDVDLRLAVDAGVVLQGVVENWGDRHLVLTRGVRFVLDGEDGGVFPGSHTDGRIAIPGLPPGLTGTVVVGPLPGGFIAVAHDVPTDGGDVTLTIERGRTLEGRIVFPEGVPVHATRPTVWAEFLGGGARGDVLADGRFVIRGVPRGECVIRARLTVGEAEFEASSPPTPGGGTELRLR